MTLIDWIKSKLSPYPDIPPAPKEPDIEPFVSTLITWMKANQEYCDEATKYPFSKMQASYKLKGCLLRIYIDSYHGYSVKVSESKIGFGGYCDIIVKETDISKAGYIALQECIMWLYTNASGKRAADKIMERFSV